MSQAFYRKWRPMQWDEVVGQEHVVHTLKNAIYQNRIVHAYLFAGPRGTGKTTTARLLAKAVNCLAEKETERPCNQCEHCLAINEGRFLDLIEIDAASNTSVDDVRDLREKINFSPSSARYKVYIIDEVHMLSNAAFNALLKTLEEPPAHAIFILATTEAHKIPATVISRCQRHDFRRIPLNFILGVLKQIVAEEKINAEAEALTLIARQSTGSMRDAISLLDQLASTGETLTLDLALSVLGSAASEQVLVLVQAIAGQQPADGIQAIHQALDGGTDPRQFARQVVDYFRNMMLIKLGNADQVEATPEMKTQMHDQMERFQLPALINALNLFNRAAQTVQVGWQPSLLLELALTGVLDENTRIVEQESKNGSWQKNTHSTQQANQKQQINPGKREYPLPAQVKVERPVERNTPPTTPSGIALTSQKETKPAGPFQGNGTESAQNNDLKLIQQNWLNIKAAVKQHSGETSALLNSVKLITMRNGSLVLAYSGDLLKSKMENSKHLDLTRQVIQEYTKLDLPIMCVVVNAGTQSTNVDLDIDGDGMVGTALAMGGKIVKKEKEQDQTKDKPEEKKSKE